MPKNLWIESIIDLGAEAATRLRSQAGHSLRWHFENNDENIVNKWMHYFPIYERHISPYRYRDVRLLEIGVLHGGSLQMWRRYLGPSAVIVGLDVDPAIADLDLGDVEVVIGDQSDPAALRRLHDEFGPFDVIIDDGSHLPEHIQASFDVLWPLLATGGTYIVEDLHTNYWPEYGGGVGVEVSFLEFAKTLVDEMHAFHSRQHGFIPTDYTRTIGGMHLYDSVVVLDRTEREPPYFRCTGKPGLTHLHGQPVEDAITDDHRAQLKAIQSPRARLRRLARNPRNTLKRWWANRPA